MRTPAALETPDAATSERSLQAKPDGGKALARLRQFSALRGLPIPATAPSDEGLEQPPEKKGGRSRAATPAECDDTNGATIALLYAEAAEALQVPVAEAATAEHAVAPAPAPAGMLAIRSWRSLGPTMMPNGQTYGSNRTTVAGRVSCVAVDPANGNHVLCGSAAGGVWESSDSGANWAPRTDFALTLTVGALAFARSAPATVYCGTGEGNFYSSLGAGVLKSTNGGTTWSRIAAAPFVGQGFYDLAVDPANAQHVLAATTSGLYVSADGGVTWTQRRNRRTWSLAFHSLGGAAAEILAACSDGVFRSANGGTTWAAVVLPGAPAGWNRLAVSMVRADPRVAYAFGSAGGAGRIFRRNAAGAWTVVPPPAGLGVGQDWYDWCLMAAPDRDNQVYVGAIDSYRGDLSGATWTWTPITAKSNGDSIHPDQHAFALHPTDPNVLFAGNDGGLYRSPNCGLNWTHLNRGLAITEVEYLAQDFGSVRFIIGGTQDNGSIRYAGSDVWEHVQDGDGGDCGLNRVDPRVCFHTFFGMGMERSSSGGGWGSWGWIGPNVPSGYNALFYPPMEVNNNTVAMAGQSVFASRNRGTNWVELPLPAGSVATAMHASTSDRLYVGTSSGTLFRFDWGGGAWTRTQLTTARPEAISDIHVEAGSPNGVWVTLLRLGGGRVFSSANGGINWTDRSGGLPALPMNSVCVDPANSNRVWVAADLGVYESVTGGGSWSVLGSGLPNVLVADLIFHPHARVLRAATRNRGVWEIPVDGWMTAPICGAQFTGTLAAGTTQRWFTFNWPATWHVIWTVMPTTLTPGAPSLTWKTQVERASAEYVTYWISVTNVTNTAVQFEGRYAILSRY